MKKSTRQKLYLAAKQDDAEAQFQLACEYDFTPPKDRRKAKLWYLKAAENEHAKAQNNLAEMIRDGVGEKPNRRKAFAWFLKAAKNGNSSAQVSAGYSYFTGEGVRKDLKQALSWYKKAAKQKHEKALYNLARMYHRGHYVKQNTNTAIAYYEKAARLDHPASCYWLAEIYNEDGLKPDDKKRIRWLRKGAELNDADCIERLGIHYHNGTGVRKDWTRGFELYRQAAKMGNTWSWYLMGLCYLYGEGVPHNKRLAKLYFKKASIEHKEARERLKMLSKL